MQISLANLLSFPPMSAQPSAGKPAPAAQSPLSSGTLASQARSPVRVAQTAVQAKAPAQPAPQPPAPASASVVTIGQIVPADEGVTYTRAGVIGKPGLANGVPDLDSMTLEKQLQVGRNLGVFTKITLHNDGVLVARPDSASRKPPEFVAAAVATMKDFQEGFATLTQRDLL